jgi:hypothetical protein
VLREGRPAHRAGREELRLGGIGAEADAAERAVDRTAGARDVAQLAENLGMAPRLLVVTAFSRRARGNRIQDGRAHRSASRDPEIGPAVTFDAEVSGSAVAVCSAEQSESGSEREPARGQGPASDPHVARSARVALEFIRACGAMLRVVE